MGDAAPNVSTEEIARFLRDQLILPHYARTVETSSLDTTTLAAVLQAASRAHQQITNNPQSHGLRALLGCADDGLRDAHEHIEEQGVVVRHTQASYYFVKKQLQELQVQYKKRVEELT